MAKLLRWSFKKPLGRGSTNGLDPEFADPECEVAATKIQAGFRGSRARKEVSAMRQRNVETTEAVMVRLGHEWQAP